MMDEDEATEAEGVEVDQESAITVEVDVRTRTIRTIKAEAILGKDTKLIVKPMANGSTKVSVRKLELNNYYYSRSRRSWNEKGSITLSEDGLTALMQILEKVREVTE